MKTTFDEIAINRLMIIGILKSLGMTTKKVEKYIKEVENTYKEYNESEIDVED